MMLRMFHVWTVAGRHEVLARDLRDAIARVGNRAGPGTRINGASEPNEVDMTAAAASESALESALLERGWRPSTPNHEEHPNPGIPWRLVALR